MRSWSATRANRLSASQRAQEGLAGECPWSLHDDLSLPVRSHVRSCGVSMTTSWKSFKVHAKSTSATISFITGGTSISTASVVSFLPHKDRDGLVNFLHAVEKAHGPLPVLTFPRLEFFRIVRSSFPVFSQLGRSEAHAELSPLPCVF